MAREAELLSIGAVARHLGVSPSTVRNWSNVGKLPAGMRVESEGRREGLRVWRRDQIESAMPALNTDERSAAVSAA